MIVEEIKEKGQMTSWIYCSMHRMEKKAYNLFDVQKACPLSS